MAAMTAASSDVMLGEWSAVHSKVQRRLTALTSQLDESIRKLADTEQQLRTEEEVRRTAEEALQKLRSSARKTTNDFESRVSALTAQLAAAQTLHDETTQQLEQRKVELQEVLSARDDATASLRQQVSSLQAALITAQRERDAARQVQAQQATSLETLEAELGELQRQVATAKALASAQKDAFQAHVDKVDKDLSDREALVEQVNTLQESNDTLTKVLAEREDELQRVRSEAAALRAELESSRRAVAAAHAQASDTQTELDAALKDKESLARLLLASEKELAAACTVTQHYSASLTALTEQQRQHAAQCEQRTEEEVARRVTEQVAREVPVRVEETVRARLETELRARVAQALAELAPRVATAAVQTDAPTPPPAPPPVVPADAARGALQARSALAIALEPSGPPAYERSSGQAAAAPAAPTEATATAAVVVAAAEPAAAADAVQGQPATATAHADADAAGAPAHGPPTHTSGPDITRTSGASLSGGKRSAAEAALPTANEPVKAMSGPVSGAASVCTTAVGSTGTVTAAAGLRVSGAGDTSARIQGAKPPAGQPCEDTAPTAEGTAAAGGAFGGQPAAGGLEPARSAQRASGAVAGAPPRVERVSGAGADRPARRPVDVLAGLFAALEEDGVEMLDSQ